jgi:NAD(P)-dependent dehydrogenase (short-subunit alcohol dehydrogenase family)
MLLLMRGYAFAKSSGRAFGAEASLAMESGPGCSYGRIVNVSSGWGSFAEGMGGPGDYSITKAAPNALTVRLAKELPPSVKVNAMCPRWVGTRTGGDEAARTPEEAAIPRSGSPLSIMAAQLVNSSGTGSASNVKGRKGETAFDRAAQSLTILPTLGTSRLWERPKR